MSDKSWPHRYLVAVQTHGGKTVTYQAVTFQTAEKAVGLAVSAHERRHSPDFPLNRIRDVAVEDMGPVSQDEQGAAAIQGADLVDRMEF